MTLSTRRSEATPGFDARTSQTPETCATCGAALATRYCPECGEMRASDRSYSIREFAREHVLEALASFDGRLLRTLKLLIRRPGELTASFMRGARVSYLPPIQLFVLCNVALFLWSAVVRIPVLDTPLSVHLRGMPYSPIATRLVEARLARTGESMAEFSARFNAVGTAQARSFVAVMVPAFAVLVGLLTVRQKRPALQHLVFSLHTYSFLFLAAPAVTSVLGLAFSMLLRAIRISGGLARFSPEISAAIIVTVAVYLALSLGRAYELTGFRRAIGATSLALSVGLILQGYRELMFFVTLWSM